MRLRLLIGRALLWLIEPAAEHAHRRKLAEERAWADDRRSQNFAAWLRGERRYLFDLDDTRSAR